MEMNDILFMGTAFAGTVIWFCGLGMIRDRNGSRHGLLLSGAGICVMFAGWLWA